jgi:hypothetical protein
MWKEKPNLARYRAFLAPRTEMGKEREIENVQLKHVVFHGCYGV